MRKVIVKRSILFVIIFLRVLILGMIGADYFQVVKQDIGLAEEGLRVSILLFYIPYSFITIIFMLPLTKFRYVGLLAIFDVIIILTFVNWGN